MSRETGLLALVGMSSNNLEKPILDKSSTLIKAKAKIGTSLEHHFQPDIQFIKTFENVWWLNHADDPSPATSTSPADASQKQSSLQLEIDITVRRLGDAMHICKNRRRRDRKMVETESHHELEKKRKTNFPR